MNTSRKQNASAGNTSFDAKNLEFDPLCIRPALLGLLPCAEKKIKKARTNAQDVKVTKLYAISTTVTKIEVHDCTRFAPSSMLQRPLLHNYTFTPTLGELTYMVCLPQFTLVFPCVYEREKKISFI